MTDAGDTIERDPQNGTATAPALRSITRHRPTVGRVDTAREGPLAPRRSATVRRTRNSGRGPSTAVGDRRPPPAVGASGRPAAPGDRLVAGETPAAVGRTDRSGVQSGTGALGTGDPAVPADTTGRATPTPLASGRSPAVSDPGSAGDRPRDPAGRRSPPLVVAANGSVDARARGASGAGDGADAGRRRGTVRHDTAGDRPTTGRSALGDTASSGSAVADAGPPGRSVELPERAVDRIVDRLSDRLARDRRIARERGGRP
jgi:hypothetical protein